MAIIDPKAESRRPSLWLAESDYPMPAIDRILADTMVGATPTGCPCRDAEVQPAATEAFVDSLEPVRRDHPAWDDP